jgi:hypothetical protein
VAFLSVSNCACEFYGTLLRTRSDFLSAPVDEFPVLELPVVFWLALVPVPELPVLLLPLPLFEPLELPVLPEFPFAVFEEVLLPVLDLPELLPLSEVLESPLSSTPSEPPPLAETSSLPAEDFFDFEDFVEVFLAVFAAASASSTRPSVRPRAPSTAPAARPRRNRSRRLRSSVVTVLPLPTETTAQIAALLRSPCARYYELRANASAYGGSLVPIWPHRGTEYRSRRGRTCWPSGRVSAGALG